MLSGDMVGSKMRKEIRLKIRPQVQLLPFLFPWGPEMDQPIAPDFADAAE